MEIQNRRERKKEETRQKIIAAAFDLFVEKGFDQTTIDQITTTADTGKGTFYNYFRSKEEVVHAIVEHFGRVRGDELWPELVHLSDTRERLRKLTERWTEWGEKYPEILKIHVVDRMQTAFNNPSALQRLHFETYVADILKMGQEAGEIRDDQHPFELVNYFNSINLIQICTWLNAGADKGLYDYVIDGVEFFLFGATKG